MATRLKFGTASSREGFTPLNTASFSDLQPARIVRELVQNSLDAAVVEAGEDTAIMCFQVDPISRRQIPDIKGYENAFKKAVGYQTRINDGKLPDAAQQVVDRIRDGLRALESGKATLLSVVDNGIGLDKKRMNSLLGDGSSSKSEQSSGSYGVGHLAPMSLSDIRYMLYGGVTRKSSCVSGRTVLASHSGQRGKLNAAQGYLIDDFRNGLDGNLYDFIGKPYPRVVASFLDQVSSRWGHGSVVMMPVFNNFRNDVTVWDVVSKVAAYNFCPAILQGKLLIEVSEDGETRKIDKNALERILEQDRERTRAARSDSFFEGLRPSGQNAYSILRTLVDHPKQCVAVSDGAAYLSLTLSPPSGNSRVDLFRNGMWITDDVFALKRAAFANRQPFHAVIEVDAERSGGLHKLIRKAEGPMHDALSFSLLSQIEKEELRRSLRQIANHIREQVPEVGNEGYAVDDFLLVNADAGSGKGGKRSFSFWGIPTVASRNRSNQLISGIDRTAVDPPDVPGLPKSPSPSKPPRPKERRSRPLPFRSTVVPKGRGKLYASIASQRDVSEIWVVLRVDENTDVTCDRIWQDEDASITSFSVRTMDANGKAVESEIDSSGKFVRVRGLSQNTTYQLDIEYNTPQELASIIGTPVLRLELHHPPNLPKGKERKRDVDDS